MEKMESDPDQSIEAMDMQESEIISRSLQQQQLPMNELHLPSAPLPIENGNVPAQVLLAEDVDAKSPYPKEPEMMAIEDMEEDRSRGEATFSYKIHNIVQLKRVDLSPPVYVRMLPWKIMVIPTEGALGCFLQCNGENDSSAWSCNAIAELRLKCHKPNSQPFTRPRFRHLFHSKENDYGYAYFIMWNELGDPDKGYMDNGSITLEVQIMAEPPHGVLWDSKKHTGYVGLKNQGATCYMNSLLQTLFFTNQLRRAVYKIPTEADDSTKSVGLSLQRVFHELQFGDRPVGTKKLTKSFGWETYDSFMQHDVQEFLRVLLDKLESKMKDTCLEGTVPNLFEGNMSSYIKCKNVDYNSTRNETYYDIQLNIKDKRTIYDSFLDYITPETLEGDNKYDAGEHGLQEASKGVIFTAFPPVLHLHLMRFQYDPVTDSSIKYNDRFEFYETINLDCYLAEKEKTPAEYVLHAVLVHSGDNHSGHYVVYINPKADGEWFKFDDDVVSSCSKLEAIERNYGGMEDEISFHDRRSSNAYMLVYIRSSELERVLSESPEQEIPSELAERLDLEKRIEIARHEERNGSEKYFSIHVILEEFFEAQQKRGLIDPEKVRPRVFKMTLSLTVDDMMNTFVKAFCVSKERMRLWIIGAEMSQTFLFCNFRRESHLLLDEIATAQKPFMIFLELAPPETPSLPLPIFDPKLDILMFFKYYDARNKRLNYIGSSQQPLTRHLCDIIPEVNELLGFAPDTELTVFDEYNDRKITKLNDPLNSVLYMNMNSLQGYILIFEKEHIDVLLELPSVEDYFLDLICRVKINFCDKSNPNDSEIVIEMSNRSTYNEMAQAVAERLNTDPNKLQFFTCTNIYKGSPGPPISYTFQDPIKDLFPYSAHSKQSASPKIYYQKLMVSIHELDNRKQFKCIWVSNDLKEEKELSLYPNNHDNVGGLLDEAAKEIQFSENSHKKLRLLKVVCHKITRIYQEDTPIVALQMLTDVLRSQSSQRMFRIEEVPAEDMQLAENEMLVPVAHYNRDTYNSFGVPFLIKAKHGEPYGVLKLRIQHRLNVPDKEWENYKFAVISAHPIEVDDGTIVDLDQYRSLHVAHLPYLRLDHINKLRKQTSVNSSEKAIKIYN